MTGCHWPLAGLLALGWLLAAEPARAAETLPSAAEVVAGYRQNLALFPAPRITIHRTLRDTPQLRRYWQQQAEAMQRVLADPARSPKQREQAEAILATARGIVAGQQREIFEHLDFWTDRRNWQARIPFRGAGGLYPAEHAFANRPLTSEALAGVFARHRIYTFVAGAEPAARAWYGIPNPGAPAYARVSDALMAELPSELALPPLALVGGRVGLAVHDVDAALAQDAGSKLRVLGFETIGNRRTIKVQHARLAPSDEPHQAPGELLTGDVITAWVDPAQGYLPLVAVWRRHWQLAGKPLNADHHAVHEVLRTTRVAKIPGAGFYPLEGSIELRSVDPLAEAMPSIDELAAGKTYRPPMVADHEILWRVDKVEPRAAAEAALYRVAFPPGTEVFDETAAARPHDPLGVGKPAPPLRVTRWTDGRERSLADYHGRVVVLYFWIAWQDACMAPLAVLNEVESKYGPAGVSVLGIHVGNVELAELAEACQAAGVLFPNALDAGTDQTPVSTLTAYRVRYYPTTVIVDRQGKIAFSTDDPSAAELTRRLAESLGIRFPLPDDLTKAKESHSWKRLYGLLLDDRLRLILGRDNPLERRSRQDP